MNCRDTIMEINMDNAFHNIDVLKKLNKNKKIISVLKANAYGHGLIGFSKILEKYNKTDLFGVATIDEGVALRRNDIKLPILVFGGLNPIYLPIAHQYNIGITCHNLDVAQKIADYDEDVAFHINIDTGMNRIGFNNMDNFKKALSILKDKMHNLEGVFTHFSSADDNISYTNKQIELFKSYLKYLPTDILIHVQNTAGCLNFPDLDFTNCIRPGIGLYGIDIGFGEHDLKELITLKSMVTHTKLLPENKCIGYNRTFKTTKDTYIATISIGYADGYKRSYKTLQTYKGSKKFNVRGNVCMDQTMIEVDDTVNVGDYITLIGDNYNIIDIANLTSISPYEVLTSLSSRLYREFYINNELVYTENQLEKF